MSIWQRVVQANRPGPPEHSVPFRAASAAAVIVALAACWSQSELGTPLLIAAVATTAVGNAPTATDYEDYRDAGNGVKMPFVVNIVGPSRPDCATITVEKIQFK